MAAETQHDDGQDPAAAHGLISTEELAAHYKITPPSVRKLMSDHGIGLVRGYPREAALAIQRPGRLFEREPRPGPGRGHRGPIDAPPADQA